MGQQGEVSGAACWLAASLLSKESLEVVLIGQGLPKAVWKSQ